MRNIFFGEVWSSTSIYKWIEKYKNGEMSVLNKQKKILKRKLTEENKERIENEIFKNRRISSKELSDILDISKSTVLAILKLLGIFYYFDFFDDL